MCSLGGERVCQGSQLQRQRISSRSRNSRWLAFTPFKLFYYNYVKNYLFTENIHLNFANNLSLVGLQRTPHYCKAPVNSYRLSSVCHIRSVRSYHCACSSLISKSHIILISRSKRRAETCLRFSGFLSVCLLFRFKPF